MAVLGSPFRTASSTLFHCSSRGPAVRVSSPVRQSNRAIPQRPDTIVRLMVSFPCGQAGETSMGLILRRADTARNDFVGTRLALPHLTSRLSPSPTEPVAPCKRRPIDGGALEGRAFVQASR